MFIKKKLKYFTRPKQISPDLSGVSGDFRIVCRPKSVRNRCVIEVFGGVFLLSCCFLDLSVGVGAFVIERSQISFFSSVLF